jgi:hypothetical protein
MPPKAASIASIEIEIIIVSWQLQKFKLFIGFQKGIDARSSEIFRNCVVDFLRVKSSNL